MKLRPEQEHYRYDVAKLLSEGGKYTAREIIEKLGVSGRDEASAVSRAVQYLLVRNWAASEGIKGSKRRRYFITSNYKGQLTPTNFSAGTPSGRAPPKLRTAPKATATPHCTHMVQVPAALLKTFLRAVQECGVPLTEGQKTALLSLYAQIV
jgi:hypothetical protein